MANITSVAVGDTEGWLLDSGEGLQATIVPSRGAVCSSLRLMKGNQWIELLHRANDFSDNGMGGRMPVLFPIVGRVFVNEEIGSYRHRGNIYPMETHGFAKTMEWQTVEHQSDRTRAWVVCQLESNEQTLRSYPYHFELRIEYAVRGTYLTVRSTIGNLGRQSMPFSLGFHPYFAAPVQRSAGFRSQCRIRVPGMMRYEMRNNAPTGSFLPLPPEMGLPQGFSVPDDGVEMIVRDLLPDADGSVRCRLSDPLGGIDIVEEFEPSQYETMTIFAPQGQPFVCLEPRTGVPMSLSDDAPGPYAGKSVEPGRTRELEFCIQLYSAIA